MPGPDFMMGGNDMFSVVFFIVFFAIFAMIIIGILSNVKQWFTNNNSPRLTVAAEVVTKRTSVSHNRSSSDDMHHSSSTWYYVTFEVESGDRMELAVSGKEYGMLVEGDRGFLTFQGTRYLGFDRM